MDNDIIAERKAKVIKRKKIYLLLGWPVMILGLGLFLYTPARSLSIVFIICGLAMRVLYYYINIELRSLERYEKLLNKTKSFFIIFFIIFSFSGNLFATLEIGDSAEELIDLEWVKGSPVKLTEKENENTYIILFWAPWDKGSILSLSILERIQREYGDRNIVITAIAKDSKEKISKFLDPVKFTPDFHIAADSKGLITKKYLGDGAGVPEVFVINNNNKILWKGNPVALESVLKKILNGNFDSGIQKEIDVLHLKLQNKMQMQKTLEAIDVADEILELDPVDEISLRVRLFIFERDGKLKEALTFIQNQIYQKNDEPILYFMKLDLQEKLGLDAEEKKNTCEEIFDRFKDDHKILERLAYTAIARMRYGSAPLPIALKAAEKAVAMLLESGKKNPAKLANYIETQARVYYSIGRISKAIEEQEKVIRLRKGDDNEKDSNAILEYYKEALSLKSSK